MQSQSNSAKMNYGPCRYTMGTLGSSYTDQAVKCPTGEDMNEWIAHCSLDIFKHVVKAYGTLTIFCTPERCPKMTAGEVQYTWLGSNNRPAEISAPEYIDAVLTWVQCQFDSEEIFPTKLGNKFPDQFLSIVKTIMSRLLQVYAHIYHNHWSDMQAMKTEAHLNTAFKSFVFFIKEFNLVSEAEQAPLKELIEKVYAQHFN